MDSSSKFKLQLPKLFSYHNQIKNPDEMGASSAGSNAALKRDSDAMFGYVGGIFSGSNNSVFKTGTPMLGDKQFFNTGAKCTKSTLQEIYDTSNNSNSTNISSADENEDKLIDRYSYLDNVTKTPHNQPVGLLYQIMDDIMDLNPSQIFDAISEAPFPPCIPVTLKTITENVHGDIETGFETQYVIVSEIEKINPCNFSDEVNPLVKEKTNATCDLNNGSQTAKFQEYQRQRNITESFSNIKYPKNYLMQLYLFLVFILFFYLFYKLHYK
jgi:hypothetical protein